MRCSLWIVNCGLNQLESFTANFQLCSVGSSLGLLSFSGNATLLKHVSPEATVGKLLHCVVLLEFHILFLEVVFILL